MKRVSRRFVWFLVIGGISWWLIPKPPLLDGIAFSHEVYDQNHHLLRLTLTSDDKYRVFVPLREISPSMVQTTLLHEDQYFYYHLGVNPVSVIRAGINTYVSGGRRLGASTLTMQLARIRFNIDSHTVGGKLQQMVRAVQLERHYSKNQLLEAYLNLVSYGGNIEGVGAASQIYFGKTAHSLTLVESLTLSVIPQSPARRTPDGNQGQNKYAELDAARSRLFARWIQLNPADQDKQTALLLPITTRSRIRLPNLAPHFVNDVITQHPTQKNLLTTLDYPLQQLLERQIDQFVHTQRRYGINNVAAMLLDYRSMEVKAMVGSADFNSSAIHGQVNGTLARRSPGSTLKPLIYALGMQQGIIHPQSMLKDSPASFNGYNPENYDREFSGPIKAQDALIKSRNLPAVAIATQLRNPSLYELLQKASIELPRSESYYGLALTLGGAEASMQDLVRLYALLANQGMLKPLRFLKSDSITTGEGVLSAEASFLTLDMLAHNPRPGQSFRNEWTRDALTVSWKTGTSHGYKDAWAIGKFGQYIIAIWIGNFDGMQNPEFVGVKSAGPLMFSIIDAIKYQKQDLINPDQVIPANLAKAHVCAVSGDIPGPYCKHAISTWFIPGVSPIKTCSIHRLVSIDTRTQQRNCNPGNPAARDVIFEFWPSDLLKLFQQAGLPRRVPPPPRENCSRDLLMSTGAPPQIFSPHVGVVYSFQIEQFDTETIPLTAISDADVRELFWFVDNRFLGKTPRQQALYWHAKPGIYQLRVVDDQGRSATREVKVALAQ